MSEAVLVVRESPADGVALLRFNRPERRNALDLEMRAAFADALRDVEADEAVRALVLAGAGEDFCAGGDVRALREAKLDAERGRRRILDIADMVARLHGFDRPVLAAVQGNAAGAGCSIALACDLVYADPGARFSLSFGRLGLVPDAGALYALPRRVGLARAKELVFTARALDAREAVAYGVATALTPGRDVVEVAVDAAAQLAQGSPTALSLAKRALNASLASDLHTMLDREADAQGICFTTAYFAEAIERFAAKQPPRLAWRDPITQPPTEEAAR